MEKNIDCMKYRKSTHLAGVDVEMIVADKSKCILTIQDCFFDKGVNVSGNKTDGYFINFKEKVKPMVVNSTNRKTIANIVKVKKELSSVDSRNIGNWNDVAIELYFDPTIKMMGKITGGIKVKAESPIPNISDSKALDLLNSAKTLKELVTLWGSLSASEKSLPTVLSLKETLKTTLK